ncbi:MAG: hypothetical protein COC12_10950 [Rhodobacteraceae bacterium]|nr:MAG: hypothetical protein COC12_10950 [Paracoccaceae bacterium]
MTWNDRLYLFSPLDYGALAVLAVLWVWINWRIEKTSPGKPSVSVLMDNFRRDWMQQMVTREPRIFDAQLVSNLRQGTAFFASASMIAIGGGLALIGNTERLAGLASDLTLGNAPTVVWEIKILMLLLFLSNAFLKFVWSHRLFGYCSVLMASVPNDPTAPLALPRASQSADLSITAARSFNRAMRSVYFALAVVAWLLGPIPLILAVVLTSAMLYRREFVSQSRQILLRVPPDTQT